MEPDPDALYRALVTRDSRFDGRLFVGVRTTGIYCRPICPARTPKRANVTFFPTAAAAQDAGFRPCLRCRPESAPDLGAWRGASNTVSRGLALIEAGALDGGDLESLADRLGVGGRHLRRLFRTHLGASPIAVAQTRRVLLAQQLIGETRLSMTEVALASGFSSVRRFNETFQALYGRPPAALRRTRARAPLAGEDGVRLKLPYRAPYDWEALIGFLGARAIGGVEMVTPRRYARAITLEGETGLLAVTPDSGERLDVVIHFPRLAALPAIIARVRRIFDLAADPGAIGEHLARDPDLAARVAIRPGLRVPGAWDGFELAVRAILGQQITVAAATALASRLAAEFGAPLSADLAERETGVTHAFPTPEALAGADLTRLPIPRSRSSALSSLARAALDEPTLFDPRGDPERAIARLTALPGVGAWTAHYIALRALRALRDPDAFPAADIGLQRALAGADGVRPRAAALEARSQAWRPWRAYAALHLWTTPDPSDPHSRDPGADHDRRAA
jgi:AraC family transcriptional regulator of adaptative response / DNA-3-methyladenine glycosylase II